MRTLQAIACGVASGGLLCPAAAEPVAWFRSLRSLSTTQPGSVAWGISADGQTVVGQAVSDLGPQAFFWTAERGMCPLGDLPGGPFTSLATAVNADGTVVVGAGKSAASGLNYEAFRWTSTTGLIGLGDLPGSEFLSQAYGVSADGATVVGLSRTLDGFEAFRWTAAQGLRSLGDLPGGTVSSCATATSASGNSIVGYGWAALGYEMFRWTANSGMVSLGELPGGAHFAVANATTPDAWTVVGQSSSELSGNGGEACRWEAGLPLLALGDLPGGTFQSVAFACSADGLIIVGQGTTEAGLEAMIWDPVYGMRRLQDAILRALTQSDLGQLDGWKLVSATGISSDGHRICGYGVNPHGITEAFVTRLPRFCWPNCDGSQTTPLLSPNDLQCFLNRFAAGDPYANCDGSHTEPVLNANDFACFIGRFAQGCS